MKKVFKFASIPIKEQLLCYWYSSRNFNKYSFNSYKGTIVMRLGGK